MTSYLYANIDCVMDNNSEGEQLSGGGVCEVSSLSDQLQATTLSDEGQEHNPTTNNHTAANINQLSYSKLEVLGNSVPSEARALRA